MGIQFEELTPGVAASLNLDKDTKGVTIVDVVEGSAAEKAKLKQYDVIVELNGEPVAAGDGVAVAGPSDIVLKGSGNAEILLFDMTA